MRLVTEIQTMTKWSQLSSELHSKSSMIVEIKKKSKSRNQKFKKRNFYSLWSASDTRWVPVSTTGASQYRMSITSDALLQTLQVAVESIQ